MKRTIKSLLLAVFSVLLICASCVFSVAEEQQKTVAYTVELADGTVTEYESAAGFTKTVESAPSGSIVTLAGNIELTKGIFLFGTEDEHKTVTIDLAGYGLYSTSKDLVSTMLAARDHATLNVTSSKPDAFIYMIDNASNSTKGGNIFSSIGIDALINVGGCVSLKEQKYPGSNISTFSSCFVDVRNMGTVGFNCDGGQHFANIADWLGFITPRSGNGTVTIKNADILVGENTALIHTQDSSTHLYLENCLIVRIDGSTRYLFNQIHSDVTMKNCVTNYSIVAQNASTAGVLTLEGKNVFDAGLGFDKSLLKNADDKDKIMARTGADVELVQGGKSFWRYDNVGRFNKLHEELPVLKEAYTLVSQDETRHCTWQYDNTEKEEFWVKDEQPYPPFELLRAGKDGMYKKGWLKIFDSDAHVIFKSTYVNDFDVKIRAKYENDALWYLVYVPAFVIDESYISYSEGKIDGAGFSSADWTEVDIDGEKYYEYVTMDMNEDDIDRIVEISLPCDILDGKKLVKTEGVYRINLSGYLAAVRKNEAAYSAEQLAPLDELESRYLSAGN